jgi:hypothetical protein
MSETVEQREMKYEAGQPVAIVAMRNQAMNRAAWIGRSGVVIAANETEGDELPCLIDVPGYGRIWVHEDDLEATR